MLDDQQLAQLFLDNDLLSPSDLAQAQALAAQTNRSLYITLITDNLVNEERAILTISKQLNVPCVSLREFEPDPKMLELIGASIAQAFTLMPLGMTEDDGEPKLYVAMANPLNLDAIDEVSRQSGLPIVPLLAGPSDVVQAINRAYTAAALSPMIEVEDNDDLVVEDIEIQDLSASSDGLSAVLDGFEDGFGDIMSDHSPSPAATPAQPAPSAAVNRPKLPPLKPNTSISQPKTMPKPIFSGGLGIDFGRIDLSNREGVAPSASDPHNQQTLRAGTKLPSIIMPGGAPSKLPPLKAPPPRHAPTPTAPTPAANPAPAPSAGLGGWGDFNFTEDELSPPSASSAATPSEPRQAAAARSENSSIRYAPSVSAASTDSVLDNIPAADLIRAAIRLLIYKGLLNEEELREEVLSPGSRSTDRPRR
jgi:hypothetical protein